MRTLAYACCFVLVAVSTIHGFSAWLLSLLQINIRYSTWLSILSFGSLVPGMVAPLVPLPVHIAAGLVMLFLVLRRAWLFLVKRERVPTSFRGLPKILGYFGTGFFIAALAAFALTIVLRAGSGVPAGMLLIPALFFVPWAFFLTEVMSFFRNTERADEPEPERQAIP